MRIRQPRQSQKRLQTFCSFAASSGALIRLLLLCLAALFGTQLAHAQKRVSPIEHWVSTWPTSQPLGPTTTLGNGRGGAPSASPQPMNAPSGAPAQTQPASAPPNQPASGQPGRGRGPQMNAPATLHDQTIRMIIHTSIGGRRVRVEFSNAMSGAPLLIGSAHIAVRDKDSNIVSGTDRALTFSGKPACTLGPGVLLHSDPLDLEVGAFSDLAVSIYLPQETGPPTNHSLGMHTAYISKGDTTRQSVMPEPVLTRAYLWLSAVDVIAPLDAFAVVALGDSITDGQGTTVDANRNWTAVLANRLAAITRPRRTSLFSIRVLPAINCSRDLAVSRARSPGQLIAMYSAGPGVKWLIVFEGINDISLHGQTDSADPARERRFNCRVSVAHCSGSQPWYPGNRRHDWAARGYSARYAKYRLNPQCHKSVDSDRRRLRCRSRPGCRRSRPESPEPASGGVRLRRSHSH